MAADGRGDVGDNVAIIGSTWLGMRVSRAPDRSISASPAGAWLIQIASLLVFTSSFVRPVLTLAGINLVIMVNVAVVVETVFSWPGIGRLLYEGVTFRDFPVVQATVLLGGSMIVIVNLLVDITHSFIDPRGSR